jgi:3-oxoacyl-(acyl-carrier-protein) synthase
MPRNSPVILRFPQRQSLEEDPIVITGVGITASIGPSREIVWQNIQLGKSGIRRTEASDEVGSLRKPCGMVDWLPPDRTSLKSIRLTHCAAAEALTDATLDWKNIDRNRFACSISAQFGDIGYHYLAPEVRDTLEPDKHQHRWWDEFLPSTVVGSVANRFQLMGPRLCHTTACASGLVSTIVAGRMIRDGQADYALCGAGDAVTELVYTAFNRMGVLADCDDASQACRPFDVDRNGFAMGEGAAMMVLEKRSTAIARNAKIYAELAAYQTLNQAHHVTGLDGDAGTMKALIQRVVQRAGWEHIGPQYINAHGTGTEQNDRCELQAIRSALNDRADDVLVSSNKAVLGHLINAAGSIELALSALALRDGYVPPTMHLNNPERFGDIDCMPRLGAKVELDRAVKLSLAFGGHLVGVALRRCPIAEHQRQSQPLHPQALLRNQPSVAVRKAA